MKKGGRSNFEHSDEEGRKAYFVFLLVINTHTLRHLRDNWRPFATKYLFSAIGSVWTPQKTLLSSA